MWIYVIFMYWVCLEIKKALEDPTCVFSFLILYQAYILK